MKKITIYIICIFLVGKIQAQIKSIPNDTETAHLIQKVLDAGCYVEKCDSTDSICFILNDLNKKTYEELKQPNIHIVRMFSPILKDSIHSYEFYKYFDQYFSIDTNNYTMYFFKWYKGKNVIFGAANCETDKLNVVSYTPVISTSFADNAFLNQSENGNLILIFSMSFEDILFVDDNGIQAIVDNKIVDGGTYFRKYDLPQINKRFKGVQKNERIN